MAQSHVTTPATGPGGDTTIKVAAKVLAGGETVQQFEAVTAVDGGAATPIGSGNQLPVTDLVVETALGTPSDAAATTTGSVIAQLRRVANLLAGGIGVTGTFWQATQPVSGTFFQATQPVSAVALPLPTGAAQDSTLTANGVLTGAVTETAPATDTASSGLNGRMQRIAQRLSTIIGVLPAALGANGGLKIEGVASGVAVPISGSLTATPAADLTASGTLAAAGSVSIATLNGNGSVGIEVGGTFTGLLAAIEATIDGSTWFQIAYYSALSPTILLQTTVTTTGHFITQISGYSGIRFRVASISTGSAVVSMRASIGNITAQAIGIASGVATIGALTANQSVNLNQVNGSAIALSHGTSASAMRVELPTDGTGVVGLNAGSNVIGGVTSAAASQADGHSATIGALADLSSASTLVGLLKAIKAAVTGTVAVSGTFWQATQPVSGTVATTSAAASQADGHSAAIGSTTDAAATTTGSVIAQLRRIANLVAGTLTVSGTVTTTPPANASTNIAQIAGTTTSVNAGTIDAGTQRVAEAGANTGTLTNVASSASSVTVLASNTARRGGTIWNDSTSVVYLKFGATASATSATVKLLADDYYEIPAFYNGRIDGLWASANGFARVTEITA